MTTDDAVARALLAKQNQVLVEKLQNARTSGKAEAIVSVLSARGLPPTEDQRQTILATTDPSTLERWLAAVATCPSVAALLDLPAG